MQHIRKIEWKSEASSEFEGSTPAQSSRLEYRVTGRTIESGADLLESFRIRFQVYCHERKFLNAADYPDEFETDEFDDSASHIGAFAWDGTMIGTVRLVRPGPHGLPMASHCVYEAPKGARVGEISRLAVPRRSTVRGEGGKFSLCEISLQLYHGLYQHCRKANLTHVLSAMEPSLERLVARMHFPFRPIGPLVDYYGWVRPYVLDLDELDRSLLQHAPSIYQLFHSPLESGSPWSPSDTRSGLGVAEYVKGRLDSRFAGAMAHQAYRSELSKAGPGGRVAVH